MWRRGVLWKRCSSETWTEIIGANDGTPLGQMSNADRLTQLVLVLLLPVAFALNAGQAKKCGAAKHIAEAVQFRNLDTN
jgi:hypothetical protein